MPTIVFFKDYHKKAFGFPKIIKFMIKKRLQVVLLMLLPATMAFISSIVVRNPIRVYKVYAFSKPIQSRHCRGE